MSGIRERALEAMPGWLDGKLVAALKQELRGQFVPGAGSAEVRERILELVSDGEPVPADIAQPELDDKIATELFNARQTTISELITELSVDQADIFAAHANKALAVLDDELQRLVAEVEELAPTLKGVRTANDAIAYGPDTIAAYKRVGELVAEYETIRQTQLHVVHQHDRSNHGYGRQVALFGTLADAIFSHPHIARERVLAANVSKDSSQLGKQVIAWLERGQSVVDGWEFEQIQRLGRTWWPEDSADADTRRQFLIWLCTNCHPWVPSIERMALVGQLMHTLTQPVRAGDANEVLRSLAMLSELTGLSYPEGVPAPLSDDQVHARRVGGAEDPNGSFDAASAVEQRLALTFT